MDPAKVAAPNFSVVANGPDPSILLKHPQPLRPKPTKLIDNVTSVVENGQPSVFHPSRSSLFHAVAHPTRKS
jgi:hypothetical protein